MEQDVIVQLSDSNIYQEKSLVLTDVSFEIKKGEFVYLVGKTGSGKSSLLRTLYADLEVKSSGTFVAGFELNKIRRNKVPLLRRKLGIIFQDFQLLSDRSVEDNLLFVTKATGWKEKVKMKERVHEVLQKVGMETKGFKFPHQLSGGEQQRVAIARALINDPELIIADEPTGNLDPETTEGIMKLLIEISQNGRAILMATHDVEVMKKFPFRTLRCEDGRIIEVPPMMN